MTLYNPRLKLKTMHSRKCVMSGREVLGDNRYRYKAWWCMSPAERHAAAARYPHSAPGIPDSAYAYPIRENGKPASARRALLWTYAHTKRRVAKYQAK